MPFTAAAALSLKADIDWRNYVSAKGQYQKSAPQLSLMN